VSYSVSVDPEVAVNYTGIRRDGAQLIVSYNTKYNVSVVASLCGMISTTNFAIIYHGKLKLVACYNLILSL
jgi:hypothetical protein